MEIGYYGKTDIGNVRYRNEDAFVLKEVWGGTHLLAVAIDGVGGNGGGDIAAEIASGCMSEHFMESPNGADSLDVLQAAVVYANNSIYALHCASVLNRMTCVLTAALINIETGQIDVCHVGDSRMYMFKEGSLKKITSDHSPVGQQEESGELTEHQAMSHPNRNRISRSVGHRPLQLYSDYIQTRTLFADNCSLLLCSDGLYDMIDSSQMVQILDSPLPVDERVEKLVGAALEAGGKDNVTVIVVDLKKLN